MSKTEFEKAVVDILKDNTSGSLTITNKLIESSLAFGKSNEFDILFAVDQYLQVFSKFPEFAVLFHFVNRALIELTQLQEKQSNVQAHEFVEFVKKYCQTYEGVNTDIAENLSNIFDFDDKTVFVHSNSSTITEVISYFNSSVKIKEIIQTISYPAKEGIIQANNLVKNDLKIHLIPDAAIFRFVKLSDVVLLSADCIFEEFFINKIGTYSLVVAANYFNKPVFVLSDSRKIIPHKILTNTLIKSFLNEKPKPEEELYVSDNKNIRIHNYYFEKTPSNLVSKFVTENGICQPKNLYDIIEDGKVSDILKGS